jgi:type IV pilus assembly protein PilV
MRETAEDSMKRAWKNMMTVSWLHNQKGFTLVEIMVAISIIAIGLLGLVSVTVMVIKGNTFSKTMTTATTLANDKMEQLKKTGYASLVSGADTAQSIYTRTWTVMQDSPVAGMKTVVVTVQWTWEGVVRNVTVRSLIAQ